MKKGQDHELENWDDFHVPILKGTSNDTMSDYESYKVFRDVVNLLPKKDLIKRGWIQSENDLKSLVPLFSDIRANRLNGLFRKSTTANIAKCAAWQSRISFAARLAVMSNKLSDFLGLDSEDLKTIAKLSIDENNIVKLPEYLSRKGVVLIYETGLPGMKLDGMVFMLESGHPVVGISFRYPRIDNFWFTLMHELAHIVLHKDLIVDPIFDDLEIEAVDNIERQANRLAKESFVKREYWRNCPPKYEQTDASVMSFAKKMEIHPAIIAGMLQKEENSYSKYRKIVDKINIRKIVFGHG